eukprot:766192-Hanusia_phi.AAC.3
MSRGECHGVEDKEENKEEKAVHAGGVGAGGGVVTWIICAEDDEQDCGGYKWSQDSESVEIQLEVHDVPASPLDRVALRSPRLPPARMSKSSSRRARSPPL